MQIMDSGMSLGWPDWSEVVQHRDGGMCIRKVLETSTWFASKAGYEQHGHVLPPNRSTPRAAVRSGAQARRRWL